MYATQTHRYADLFATQTYLPRRLMLLIYSNIAQVHLKKQNKQLKCVQ